MRLRLIAAACCALGVVVNTASAQTPDFLRTQAALEPLVRGQPFSADGTVTLKLVLFDGTRIERTVTAKYYRDSEGRVRREQTIMGLSPLDPGRDAEAVVTIVDPVAGFMYTIVGRQREAQRMAIGPEIVRWRVQDNLARLQSQLPVRESPAPGSVTKEESLGTRDVNGVRAAGRKTTTTIPIGTMGNDRPIEVTDEVWTAEDLKLQILVRHHDPRTGDVETQFTQISRAEPSADLFRIPAGYKIVDIPRGINQPPPSRGFRPYRPPRPPAGVAGAAFAFS